MSTAIRSLTITITVKMGIAARIIKRLIYTFERIISNQLYNKASDYIIKNTVYRIGKGNWRSLKTKREI